MNLQERINDVRTGHTHCGPFCITCKSLAIIDELQESHAHTKGLLADMFRTNELRQREIERLKAARQHDLLQWVKASADDEERCYDPNEGRWE